MEERQTADRVTDLDFANDTALVAEEHWRSQEGGWWSWIQLRWWCTVLYAVYRTQYAFMHTRDGVLEDMALASRVLEAS